MSRLTMGAGAAACLLRLHASGHGRCNGFVAALRRNARAPLLSMAVFVGAQMFLAAPASAYLRICDQTSSPVSVAVARSFFGGFSQGWWALQPGQCATTITGPLRTDLHYWYYATYDPPGLAADWASEPNDAQFCVDPVKAFTLEKDFECPPENLRHFKPAITIDNLAHYPFDPNQEVDITPTGH